jgi:hypothetical protein
VVVAAELVAAQAAEEEGAQGQRRRWWLRGTRRRTERGGGVRLPPAPTRRRSSWGQPPYPSIQSERLDPISSSSTSIQWRQRRRTVFLDSATVWLLVLPLNNGGDPKAAPFLPSFLAASGPELATGQSWPSSSTSRRESKHFQRLYTNF